MMHAIEWLLGLQRIRLAGGPLTVEFSRPPAAWVMLGGTVLVVLLVGFVYRFEHGGRGLRLSLAVVRAAILLLVLGLLARPNLVRRRDRVDPSVVAVLLDQSASMNIRGTRRVATTQANGASTPSPSTGGFQDGLSANRSRYEQAVAALEGAALAELRKRHRVEVWTFDESALRLERAADDAALERLAHVKPLGRQTDACAAVAQVLEQTQGARLAAVIVLSDGRQTRASGVERLAEESRQRQSLIHAVALGSENAAPDIAVESVRADEDVCLKDIASVWARIEVSGSQRPREVRVRLVDAASGAELDRRSVPLDAGVAATWTQPATREVQLRFRPQREGTMTVRVEAEPALDEAETGNNSGEAVIEVHDQKLRVLYVEGPPRFEYRFLKNTLLREATVTSSCLLLDATAGFAQEGSEPIRRFPNSPGELGAYDVVLLGDVDPHDDWISPAQMAMLSDFVAVRGGGLGFIAGERAMPRRLRGTPLEKLLPVRIDADAGVHSAETAMRPFAMQPTADGRRSGLLRFEVDPDENDATIAALGGWYWYARVLGRKPGTEVLAVHPTETCADGPMPLMVAGRYGAGRTLFVGSDDTWRWRRYHGEAYYDTFWLNALRLLGGERRLGAARRWRLETDRQVYDVAQRVSFRLVARDPDAARGLTTVDLRLARGDGEAAGSLHLERTADESAFEAAFWPDRAGVLTAAALVPDSVGEARPPTRTISIRAADAERRTPQADHDFLRDLAARTGGRCVRPDELVKLARAIPDHSMRIADDLSEPLWDTRLALLLFMGLVTTEWLARKLKGLA